MSRTSRLVARAFKLPPPRFDEVDVERDLEVKMPDSVVLLADRWYPASVTDPAPIVLLRSPYGRRQMGFFGRLFSERGYQCVIQSCRGTFGSGGTFDPFFNERADGLATLDWLAEQPWFTGSVGTFGPSYLGLTQWAIAGDAPDFLKAMALDVTASKFRDICVYPGGTFALETGAFWVDFVLNQELKPSQRLRAMATSTRRTALACSTLPLGNADTLTHGRELTYYQDWLVHAKPDDPWWDPVNFSLNPGRVPPASLVGGWYDIFLPGEVDDFVRLREAGREARLTIGPWTHTSPRGGAEQLRDAFEWFDVHLRDTHLRSSPPVESQGRVRLYVMGAGRWVSLPEWPPPATTQRWHLQPEGQLSVEVPAGGPDRYRYDPSDPTPSLGGASLDLRRSGIRDQRRREIRDDVLTYTSAPLVSDLTVAGPLKTEVWVRSSHPFIDMFARLCDVDTKGKSINIADGIIRLDGEPVGGDGPRRAEISMWPTAITFKCGHRIRLQISSGAHPLFARNTGTGEPLGTARTLVASDVEVLHDPDHPSGIDLPVSLI